MFNVIIVPEEADEEQFFCRSGKKLGGVAALHEKNAQVTLEEGCHIIQSLVQLRITEKKSAEANAMAHQKV